jgi:hypothetical protein
MRSAGEMGKWSGGAYVEEFCSYGVDGVTCLCIGYER